MNITIYMRANFSEVINLAESSSLFFPLSLVSVDKTPCNLTQTTDLVTVPEIRKIYSNNVKI